ncbi:PREDICTED: TBCC domain-containing protein 1-like [Priapulus caudatus]|uniref:TBCC domain-containing protein 1-like n=1 Tax=Priapulus caudatus TaxID=37621 RepID=A0ABM1DU31_PRICU|nr:PREDICTED: TBCC domain-containing protein 1-like [Priapulus caudatus]
MAESKVSDIVLWVKPEPFNFGALHLQPHSRLSLHNIKKIVAYSKTKANLGFPRLSYSVWKHIACNKLSMSEELAWMYFSLCDLLSEKSRDQFLRCDRLYARGTSAEEKRRAQEILTVDTLHFVLLLFIQHLNKISLRSSLVPGEEWPVRSRSPSPDLDSRASPAMSRSLDEQNHLSFVVSNLTSMLELLTNSDLTDRHDEAMVPYDAVISLGWLIGGSVDRGHSATPLHDIATMPTLYTATGYAQVSRAFSFKALASWIQASLGVNPFGVSSCIIGGRRLSWPLGGESHSVSVSVQKCRSSTIVLGAVETAVQVTGCKHLKLVAACRQLIISSSSAAVVHVLTPSHPLILQGCADITLAPYHTFYPQLDDHLRTVGLSSQPSCWDAPLSIDKDYKEDSSAWKLMDPKHFYLFNIPFEMDGTTKSIPEVLPTAYREAVQQREQHISNWQTSVKEAGLTKQQRKQFQALVEAKFQEWLIETGHKRELDGLVMSSHVATSTGSK